MPEASLKTLASGYLRAYGRLQKTALDPAAVEEIFIALFETLNWLDALLWRSEVEQLVASDLRKALQFVRGRVHHRWAEAIEFRTDVVLPRMTINFGGSGAHFVQPGAIADWCWCQADDLPGGTRSSSSRSSQRSGEAHYRHLLAGQQARSALEQLSDLAGRLAVT